MCEPEQTFLQFGSLNFFWVLQQFIISDCTFEFPQYKIKSGYLCISKFLIHWLYRMPEIANLDFGDLIVRWIILYTLSRIHSYSVWNFSDTDMIIRRSLRTHMCICFSRRAVWFCKDKSIYGVLMGIFKRKTLGKEWGFLFGMLWHTAKKNRHREWRTSNLSFDAPQTTPVTRSKQAMTSVNMKISVATCPNLERN
jgi:hypothetical protein